MTQLKALTTLAAVLGALSISACNTIEGAGRDVQEVGEAVEQSAAEVAEEIDEETKNP